MKRKTKYYIISFIIPLIVFSFSLYSLDVYPFGNNSLRLLDALTQYSYFFCLVKKIQLFTLNIGLGSNVLSIYYTYLNSPLNLLYLLFNNAEFDLFYVILVMLKFGLASLNMNLLLNYKKKYNKSGIIFSLIYALCGYSMVEYLNIQFLDALYMLPLVIIGIKKIISDNNSLMYFVTLVLTIIFNYYIGYMVGLFSIIYFLFEYFNYEERNKKVIKNFIITNIFVICCSLFILYPIAVELFNGRGEKFFDINILSFNKRGLSFIFDFTPGSLQEVDLINASCPIYISLFAFLNLILLFFNSKYSKKYKISILAMIIIYLLSLSFGPLYYLWHLFQEPNFFPGRFIFTFSCFFIMITYDNYINIDNINIKLNKKIIITVIYFILLIVSFILKIFLNGHYKSLQSVNIIMLVFSMFLFIVYLFMYKNKVLIYFLIVLELICNSIYTINYNYSLHNYIKCPVSDYINEYNNVYSKINNIKSKENLFSRIYINASLNYGLLYNYYDVTSYSSIYNNSVKNLYNYFYDNLNTYGIINYQSNLFLNTILSIKYFINDDVIEEYSTTIDSIGFLANEVDNYVSSLELMENIANVKLENSEYILDVEKNNILELDDCFKVIDNSKDNELVITYKLKEDSYVSKYVYNDSIKIYINDEINNYPYSLNKGDILKVVINIQGEVLLKSDIEFNFVTKSSYDKLVNKLKEHVITNFKEKNNGFTGDIKVDDDSVLVLAVPYNSNYVIKLNGKKVSYYEAIEGLVVIDVKKGNYKVNFEYSYNYLYISLFISFIGLVGYVIVLKNNWLNYN